MQSCRYSVEWTDLSHSFGVLVAVLVGTLALFAGSQSALAQAALASQNPHRVNCDQNQTITQAIESGHSVIEFSGTCDEDVSTDGLQRLEIRGSGASPELNVITGSVTITGPTALQLANFQVGEEGEYEVGVFLEFGVTGRVVNLTVYGAFAISTGSAMRVDGSTVEGTFTVSTNAFADVRGGDPEGDGFGPTRFTGTVEGDQAAAVLQDASAVFRGWLTMEKSEATEAVLTVGNSSRLLLQPFQQGEPVVRGVRGGVPIVTVARMGSAEFRAGTIECTDGEEDPETVCDAARVDENSLLGLGSPRGGAPTVLGNVIGSRSSVVTYDGGNPPGSEVVHNGTLICTDDGDLTRYSGEPSGDFTADCLPFNPLPPPVP